MRVLICGDRGWTDALTIKLRLEQLQAEYGRELFVITGGASGADTIASRHAKELGIDQVVFPANWEGRGLAAGYFRNGLMLRMGKPHLVIAFHRFIQNSKGTKMMVEIARKAGVKTELISAPIAPAFTKEATSAEA